MTDRHRRGDGRADDGGADGDARADDGDGVEPGGDAAPDGGTGTGTGREDTAAESDAPWSPAGAGTPALRVADVTKRYGGLVANDGVSFAVERGSITGLIGPNGAGKSTLFDCVTGFDPPDAGSVFVDGTEVTGDPPHEIARRGLVRSFQTPRKPEGMTVREALLVGPQSQTGESLSKLFTAPGRVHEEESASLDRAERLLSAFGIEELATALATDLSGGQMKLVELARAMMADPAVLLLDEPVAGVNPTLAKDLKEHVRRLNDDGITMLIIEHDMEFIMDVADRIVVLARGQVLAEGSPERIRSDERVVDAYLGGGRDE